MRNLERMGAAFKDMMSFGKGKETEQSEEAVDVSDLHAKFLNGVIGQRELFDLLPVDQITEFINYHQGMTPEMDASENRQLYFKLNQINNMVESGALEKGVNEAHGINVIERWN